MKKLIAILLLTVALAACGHTQNKPQPPKLVGPCEGCEAVFEWGDKTLKPVDTLPDFNDPGMRIKVTGTIYHEDGTPAKDVVLYIYHTNQQGIYATRGGEKGWARRHGYIRGWAKTGADGKYTFYTLKPGTYPSRAAAAHIHPIVLEPDGRYYWIDEYLFRDDSLLTAKQISPEAPRGGNNGILNLVKEGGLWVGTRDIILGKNIPGYH